MDQGGKSPSFWLGATVNVTRSEFANDSYHGTAKMIQIVGQEVCVEFANGDQVWFTKQRIHELREE